MVRGRTSTTMPGRGTMPCWAQERRRGWGGRAQGAERKDTRAEEGELERRRVVRRCEPVDAGGMRWCAARRCVGCTSSAGGGATERGAPRGSRRGARAGATGC